MLQNIVKAWCFECCVRSDSRTDADWQAQWDDNTKINMSFDPSSESECSDIKIMLVFIYPL